jgi:hypothetical protein
MCFLGGKIPGYLFTRIYNNMAYDLSKKEKKYSA